MKIPRDLGGEDLAKRLGRYGYEVRRQTGSHLRLISSAKGVEHHLTIPRHQPLRIGTLSAILGDVAHYLERDKQDLMEDLLR